MADWTQAHDIAECCRRRNVVGHPFGWESRSSTSQAVQVPRWALASSRFPSRDQKFDQRRAENQRGPALIQREKPRFKPVADGIRVYTAKRGNFVGQVRPATLYQPVIWYLGHWRSSTPVRGSVRQPFVNLGKTPPNATWRQSDRFRQLAAAAQPPNRREAQADALCEFTWTDDSIGIRASGCI